MNDRLLNLYELLRTSLWFVPTIMVISALGLSWIALKVDEALLEKTLIGYPWVFTGSPEAAREILSVIASSTISVAALVFSMTMVALTLASSQFGPRILRNFIKDTGNQLVLGTFLSTYIYCLIVLRSVRGLEGNSFVPQISVTLAMLFLLASMGVLIYFIHHVVTSIQANYVIDGISKELREIICRIYPENETPSSHQKLLEPVPQTQKECVDAGYLPITAQEDGYLQTIDYDALLKVAADFNARFQITLYPGQYVIQRQPLVYADCETASLETLADPVNRAFILGPRPTPTQDVEFSVDQLVEIALRALSPGINDPFTAISCVDHLGNALALLFRRQLPSPYHFDEKGHCRIIGRPVSMSGVIDAAFNQIRQYGSSSVSVTARLLETIARIGVESRTETVRTALERQALIIKEKSEAVFTVEYDRMAIAERYNEALEAISNSRNRYPCPSEAAAGFLVEPR